MKVYKKVLSNPSLLIEYIVVDEVGGASSVRSLDPDMFAGDM